MQFTVSQIGIALGYNATAEILASAAYPFVRTLTAALASSSTPLSQVRTLAGDAASCSCVDHACAVLARAAWVAGEPLVTGLPCHHRPRQLVRYLGGLLVLWKKSRGQTPGSYRPYCIFLRRQVAGAQVDELCECAATTTRLCVYTAFRDAHRWVDRHCN